MTSDRNQEELLQEEKVLDEVASALVQIAVLNHHQENEYGEKE